jgi:hypothetical protein
VDGYDSSPSHYKELPGVPFDISMDNKISPAIINHGVTVSERCVVIRNFSDRTIHQLLESTFKGQVTARHLLLVAASSPFEAQVDLSSSGNSDWQRIAQRLQEVTSSFQVVARA